ncbi:CNNM domain-containing protein [Methylobacillus caricis]|uniref:HlyC/CorC family transporter n=1 Tax=Methylobacillus caricis TaxID=1971611 RepID=UPI001D000AAD|nr:CNNM domain-containing protein [Methylobacillus caricis]MCB5186599.1 CNNM domain-containing protein [Methylobacillus caricis]
MDIPLLWQLGILALLLFISAFFSMAETSLMMLNRHRLKILAKEGLRSAHLASRLLHEREQFLGAILLGNTLANAAASTLAAFISIRLFNLGELLMPASTLIITFAILVFSEITPKVIAARHAEPLALAFSYVLLPLVKVGYPLIWLANLCANSLLRLLGMKVSFTESSHTASIEELRSIFSESTSPIPQKHREVLLNLLDLEQTTVDDIMTVHTQLEIVDFDAPMEDILQQITHCHHTRLPVRKGPTEEIIGMLHIRKIINALRQQDLTQRILTQNIESAYFIPSGTPLYTQMQEFQQNQQRIALVVDEYGELKGLVTLEDIIKAIIGDFASESMVPEQAYRKESKGSWLVDASSSLRDINKKLGISLPVDGPRTLNGLIIEHFEDIPESGIGLKIGDFKLEIIKTQDRTVKTVRIYP